MIQFKTEEFNTEEYDRIYENPFKSVRENPLSTFSIDVDTASYSNVRRFLGMNRLPPPDAVRIEELINYFTYEYPLPREEHPFSIYTEIGECPWNEENRLVHIGLQGKPLEKAGYLSGSFGKQHVAKGRFWSEEEFIIAANEFVSHFELIGPYTGKDDEYDIITTLGNPGHILGGIYPEKEDCSTRCIDSGYKFIEKAQAEQQPFFLRLNIEWPHAPILAPPPYDTLYDPKDLPIRYFDEEKDIKGRSDFDLLWTKKYSAFTSSKENVDKHWRYYMGSVAYLDSQIGKVLDYLKDNGLRENTIIVFSSDHGHMMGERGVMEKGGFDRNSLSVPFIWSWPGHIPEGKRVKELSEMIDLPRTLLSLCGLSDLILHLPVDDSPEARL